MLLEHNLESTFEFEELDMSHSINIFEIISSISCYNIEKPSI